ncbi:hypothetical protein LQF12_04370 [Ruania suaedae]|uniref:hypothetical protein n=1 Tax=Ruania suaedae TaxID=2897774 RepID=UPI001E655F0D|nr:hypothetical protein [Ruania suaedae]UFU03849.1 hypothetical protein LQF12_04370 [Ruania suaedae]
MPSRRVLIVTAAVVVVAVVIAVALSQRSDGERTAALEAWHADLRAWESEQTTALAPPEGVDLSPGPATWLSPVWAGGAADAADADAVNAACTTLTAYGDQVDFAPEPPAAPAELEPTAQESEQFEADQAALAGLRAGLTEPLSEVRRYCGTVPTLLAARGEGDAADAADANRRIAESLRVQCPLPELEAVCAATVEAAEALAGGAGEPEAVRARWAEAVVGSDLPGLADADPQQPEDVEAALAEVVTEHADGVAGQVQEVASEFVGTW